MESSNKLQQHEMLHEVLSQCGHQAKRIKKLARSTSAFAKQSKLQSDKVQVLSQEAAAAISSELSKCASFQINALSSESTNEIQSKLKELFSHFPNNDETTKMEPECSTRDLNKESPQASTEMRFPVPPASFNSTPCDEAYSDDVSDCESDFFPDWSSLDSCGSSMGSKSGSSKSKYIVADKDEIFLNDEDLLKLSDEDFDFPIDDEDGNEILMEQGKASLEDGFDKGECSFTVSHLPVPACGNKLPGTRSQLQEKAPFTGVESHNNTVMKPNVLRRVRSMVLENDLEDGVDVGKRMFVIQQKRNVTSVTTQPSPLLTVDDITALRKSTSQTSTKYTLKRSRSNISTELSSYKRNSILQDTQAVVILERLNTEQLHESPSVEMHS